MPIEHLPRIAIAIGDPAGIGPEVSLKTALDAGVNSICRPVLVGDRITVIQHAWACGLEPNFRFISAIDDADWSSGTVNVLEAGGLANAKIEFGVVDAVYGRATIAATRCAIRAALDRSVEAVVAAPHNETAIAQAGIPFDGNPSFVARETGMQPDDVFMMLCFDDVRIVHATLHVGVRDAIARITREHVVRTIRATDEALRRLNQPSRRILVSGLNPHAGEGGLFGREEIEIIAPAIADAAASGIAVSGPFGADTMFHMKGADAFVVMLHDQGHITAKLLGFARTAALTIGSPVLFSSVAHGSAFDIAGKNQAQPAAMIEAVARMAAVGAADN
jgi:4-hydroxythreonine-4-phosphate dehydrogenase